MDALVTDAHVRSSVWFARGLLRAGVRVVALGPTLGSPGRWSRGLADRALGPDAHVDPVGYAAAVAACVADRGALVVYPGQEESIDALLDAGDRLPSDLLLPYPDAAVLRRIRDKRALPELAAGAGLRTPPTLYEGTAGALPSGLPTGRSLVKPLQKGGVLARAHAVTSPADLRSALAGVPHGEQIAVQQDARGPLSALCLVLDRDGAVVARFQQRTRRTWPADAGASRVAVGVEPDEDLIRRVAAMLAGAGFWGLAEVQFIEAPDGPALIDVNPRPYGSISLALAAGVDLPGAWHAVATGDRPPRPGPYRAGVTYRWLEAELTAALHGDLRSLVWRAPHPRVGAMWAADDPAASLLLAGRAVGGWVARQMGRFSSGAAGARRALAAPPSAAGSPPAGLDEPPIPSAGGRDVPKARW